jgi:hypothetical protein
MHKMKPYKGECALGFVKLHTNFQKYWTNLVAVFILGGFEFKAPGEFNPSSCPI